MKNFLLALICLIPISIGLVSCGATAGGPSLVLTESTNVKADKLNTPEVVTVPLKDLKGDVGKNLRTMFESRGSDAVLTNTDNLLNTPNAIMIRLDENATKDLFSDSFLAALMGIAQGVPGIGTWLSVGLGVLGLLFKNFRTNTFNAADRLIPFTKDPNGVGGLPDHTDVAAAIADIGRAITLQPPAGSNAQTNKVPING